MKVRACPKSRVSLRLEINLKYASRRMESLGFTVQVLANSELIHRRYITKLQIDSVVLFVSVVIASNLTEVSGFFRLEEKPEVSLMRKAVYSVVRRQKLCRSAFGVRRKPLVVDWPICSNLASTFSSLPRHLSVTS